MKFKAHREAAGTWFINTGKKGGKQYGKRFNNELEAKQQAILLSFDYYHQQMDDAYSELEKICDQNSAGEIKPIGSDTFNSQGDFMC